MSLEETHNKIRMLSPAEEDHDFVLYTDGAGYTDSYAASASIMTSDKYRIGRAVRVAAFNGQSTDRAEFEALLHGLQSIVDTMGWGSPGKIKDLQRRALKPSVCWYSDRESLVLAVYRDETGEPFYRRERQKDLWARLEFYETLFCITPMYIPRNSKPHHATADRLASECRILLKDYMGVITEDGALS